MKFVDANIIIKAFTLDLDATQCRGILQDDAITDTLCLIEAQDGIAKISKDKIHASQSVRSLFKGTIHIIEIDKNSLFEALKRVESYNLNIFDLIHYITALQNNCSEFVSYDKDFDRLEIKRTEP